MKSLALLSAAALISSTASATFTGLTVESTFHAATGRNVYSIYANFSLSNDRILNVFDTMNISGTMSALHNDNAFGDIDTDGDGYADVYGATGAWSQTWNNAAGIPSDSFVTIGSPGPVALDPGFTGPYVSGSIANLSGWYDSTPGSQNLIGTTLRVKILQIARLAAGETTYVGQFNVGYGAFGTTTPLFSGNVQYTLAPPPPPPDADGDGVLDGSDNCPLVANPSQADCDADGLGDACEGGPDCNGNGIPDSCDLHEPSTDRLAQFSGASGSPLTYTEDGITFTSGQTHIHLDGDSIRNHNGCCTTPITITVSEPTFTLRSVDVLATTGTGTVLVGSNGTAVALTTSGHIEFGTQFHGVSWVKWEESSGSSTLDNVAISTGPPAAADCNSNGIPDSCDIATGLAGDCNANGIPDSCDIAAGLATDCNSNGIPDSCDIATGFATDCNNDAIPDTCQGAVMVTVASENLGAPSGDDARVVTFTDLLYAESSVQLTVDVRGDLNGVTEWIDVSLNGTAPRRFFEADGIDCPQTPDRATIVLTRQEFQALVGSSGALTVSIACPATVDPTECKGTGSTELRLSYVGINPATGDCNGDHRLDVCAIADGTSPDCNSNGIPDSCDIASGFASDCNANGVPDSCDVAGGSTADCNSNGIPDACDIAAGSPDIDGDGRPDECQTTVLTSGASIQGAIESAPAGEMRIITLGAGTYVGAINFGGRPIVIRGAGASTTTISGMPGASTSVIQMAYEPALAAIEGVTIRGGETGTPHPETPKVNVGGGIFMFHSAASMRDCIIESNRSGLGGGGYFAFSTGSIERCIFRNNFAATNGGGFELYGGTPHVIETTVESNICSEGRGGGVHVYAGAATLVDTTIRFNSSGTISGGLSWDPDGDAAAFLALDGCTITGNTAGVVWGGIGVVPDDGPVKISLQNSTVCSNTPMPNFAGEWIDLGENTICDCATDLNSDGVTNGVDLAQVLIDWGNCGACASDIDGDGIVGGPDLAQILVGWGECGGPTAPPPLAWATTIEPFADPAVVTDANLRAAILATGLPWRVRDNASNIEMLLVPPGVFMMGCSQGSNQYGCYSYEQPVHQVTLTSAFYMGRTEVTQAQWQAEMGNNPSYFVSQPNNPVEQVSWNTIQGFLSQNSLRLPTEAEWEFACRAGTTTPFYNGSTDDNTLTTLAWYYGNNSPYGTKPVATKLPNALGLYDTLGNVWEWVNDYWAYYPSSGPATNPQGPVTGSYRVLRGGDWNNNSNYCRASNRGYTGPYSANGYIGFRVARTP